MEDKERGDFEWRLAVMERGIRKISPAWRGAGLFLDLRLGQREDSIQGARPSRLDRSQESTHKADAD